MTAKEILNPKHPLHATFQKWLKKKGSEPTKRKAREFLAAYPQYKSVKAA